MRTQETAKQIAFQFDGTKLPENYKINVVIPKITPLVPSEKLEDLPRAVELFLSLGLGLQVIFFEVIDFNNYKGGRPSEDHLIYYKDGKVMIDERPLEKDETIEGVKIKYSEEK